MFKLLLKVRLQGLFHTMFRGRKKPGASGSAAGGIGKKIGIGLLALYVVAALMFAFGAFFSVLADSVLISDYAWLYFAMAGILAFTLCFVGSVFSTQTQLFDAKDNELLLSMPVTPISILFSRIAALALYNLIYCAAIMLPAGVVYCMYATPTVLGVIFFILSAILISLLSLAVSCVFGWLVALISSHMRKKTLISTVLFLAFFVAYFYFYSNIQGIIGSLIQNGAEISHAIKSYALPFYNFALACTGSVIDMLLMLLWGVVPMAAIIYVLSRFFISIATTKKGAAKLKYVRSELKTSSVRGALLRKELSRFFSLSVYIINCALGPLLMVALAVFLALKWQDYRALLPDVFGQNALAAVPLILCAVECYCCSMTITTAASVSIEGNRFWILKTVPVKPTDVFYAKIGVNLIISIPFCILSCVACSVITGCSLLETLLVTLCVITAQYFTAALGLIFNILMPKFDWINETYAVKQSMSVFLTMMAAWVLIIVPFIICFVISGGSAVMRLLMVLAFFVILGAAATAYLLTGGQKAYEKIAA